MSPLEDTIVALRPVVPQVPFEVPNAIRALNPMMPLGSQSGFNNIDPQGNPTGAIVNSLVNMGWEYVIHCHILSHEEMDMMRPESLALPPNTVTWPATGGAVVTGNGNNRHITLTWADNSITETACVVQRSTDGTSWVDVGTVTVPLTATNIHQSRTLTDSTSNPSTAYLYRVVAQNTVGYGKGFPTMTASSTSATLGVNAPAAPTTLTATLAAGPQVSLTWRDNATNEAGFLVERSVNGGAFARLATPPARANTGTATYVDGAVSVGGFSTIVTTRARFSSTYSGLIAP